MDEDGGLPNAINLAQIVMLQHSLNRPDPSLQLEIQLLSAHILPE